MGFVLTFWGALLGLCGLFALKMWELKTGRVLCRDRRSRVNKFLTKLVEDAYICAVNLPKRTSVRKALHNLAYKAMLVFAKSAKFINRYADTLAMKLSHSARKIDSAKSKGVSSFLKEVGEHKDGLDIEARKRETMQ